MRARRTLVMAEEKKVKTAVEAVSKEEKATKKPAKKSAPTREVSRLEEKYRTTVIPEMMKEFEYTTVMQVPAIHKIVINLGVGDGAHNAKVMEDAVRDLTTISGQKPIVIKARKSVAAFKLREGQ